MTDFKAGSTRVRTIITNSKSRRKQSILIILIKEKETYSLFCSKYIRGILFATINTRIDLFETSVRFQIYVKRMGTDKIRRQTFEEKLARATKITKKLQNCPERAIVIFQRTNLRPLRHRVSISSKTRSSLCDRYGLNVEFLPLLSFNYLRKLAARPSPPTRAFCRVNCDRERRKKGKV